MIIFPQTSKYFLAICRIGIIAAETLLYHFQLKMKQELSVGQQRSTILSA
jgi:hypothetical protein